MAINLLNLQPHKVSRDLSGYITYIYGAPKTGKTTLATQMPSALLLAFERGYNALPGVMAQDITSWADMKLVYRELKKSEVKEIYKTVIIDTVDIAADFCQKYICQQLNVSAIGDASFGKGWAAFKAEFNDTFRGLAQLGYAVFFIGHDKEEKIKDNNDNDRIYIRPALGNSVRKFIEGMADIYGYAHQKRGADMSVITCRSEDDTISCGGRFKYIKREFPMTYQNLRDEIIAAIDKEAAEHNGEFVTNEREKDIDVPVYDYDALMNEFNQMAEKIMTTKPELEPKVRSIIDRYLGKGHSIADTNIDQAEMVSLIVTEIREDILPLVK